MLVCVCSRNHNGSESRLYNSTFGRQALFIFPIVSSGGKLCMQPLWGWWKLSPPFVNVISIIGVEFELNCFVFHNTRYTTKLLLQLFTGKFNRVLYKIEEKISVL